MSRGMAVAPAATPLLQLWGADVLSGLQLLTCSKGYFCLKILQGCCPQIGNFKWSHSSQWMAYELGVEGSLDLVLGLV